MQTEKARMDEAEAMARQDELAEEVLRLRSELEAERRQVVALLQQQETTLQESELYKEQCDAEKLQREEATEERGQAATLLQHQESMLQVQGDRQKVLEGEIARLRNAMTVQENNPFANPDPHSRDSNPDLNIKTTNEPKPFSTCMN